MIEGDSARGHWFELLRRLGSVHSCANSQLAHWRSAHLFSDNVAVQPNKEAFRSSSEPCGIGKPKG